MRVQQPPFLLWVCDYWPLTPFSCRATLTLGVRTSVLTVLGLRGWRPLGFLYFVHIGIQPSSSPGI